MDLNFNEESVRIRPNSPLTTNEMSFVNSEKQSQNLPNVTYTKPLYHSSIKLTSTRYNVRFMVKSIEQMKRFWGQYVTMQRYNFGGVPKNLGISHFFIPKSDNITSSSEMLTRKNNLEYYINGHGRYIVGVPIYRKEALQYSNSKIVIIDDALLDKGIYLIVSIVNPYELQSQGYFIPDIRNL